MDKMQKNELEGMTMTTKKEYCTGRDCANNPLPRLETRGGGRDGKWQRALSTYNGWHGPATIAHIERNIAAVWPTAYRDLTGKKYDLLMSVANHSYQDASYTQAVKEWEAYDGPLDWLAGIGNNGDAIEVDGDKITIKINRGMKEEEIRVYRLEATNAR